jgi:UDP-N-acetylglucosamine 2-epimerase
LPLADILGPRFSQLFSDGMVEVIKSIDAAERLAGNTKPTMLVGMEDITPIRRAITRVCRINRIPSLVIQHGAYGPDVGGFEVFPLEADKQAVWGVNSRNWSIEKGKSPESEVITGNPRYDRIAAIKTGSTVKTDNVHQLLGLNTRSGIVLIATQWYQPISACYAPEDIEAFIWCALSALRDIAGIQIVVKLHPAFWLEYMALTQAIAVELGIDDLIITEKFLFELLEMCDVLITQTSTVGLEAILLDKPVIIFGEGEVVDSGAWSQSDAVIRVRRVEDLPRAVEDALHSEEVRAKLAGAREVFVRDYIYSQDGKASFRIANLIRSMIDHSSNGRC